MRSAPGGELRQDIVKEAEMLANMCGWNASQEQALHC